MPEVDRGVEPVELAAVMFGTEPVCDRGGQAHELQAWSRLVPLNLRRWSARVEQD
jgi:hypothetical protein